MNAASVVIALASAVAPPEQPTQVPAGRSSSTPVAPPPGGPSGRSDSGASNTRAESAAEREQRLIREGIRKPPQPVAKPSNDYLSVLGRRLDPEGQFPVRPPQLWFGFGFASRFALRESAGRTTTPLGAHHIFGQLTSWGADDRGGAPCGRSGAAAAEDGRATCSFSSLHAVVLASHSEVAVKGRGQDDVPLRFSVLVDDTDIGLAYRRDWLRTWGSSTVFSWGWGWLAGYIPARQRYVTRYGYGVADDADLRSSGFQFNPLGTVARVSLSLVALSVFEGTMFAGVVTGSPAEARLWIGLEFALRSPADMAQPEDAAAPAPSPPSNLPGARP